MAKIFYGLKEGWSKQMIFDQLGEGGNNITSFVADDITDNDAQWWANAHAEINRFDGEERYCNAVSGINAHLIEIITARKLEE